MLACHAGGPGSIPGRCNFFILFCNTFSFVHSVHNLTWSNACMRSQKSCGQKVRVGGAGYRSRYLSHAKRALYHLSYAPCTLVASLVALLNMSALRGKRGHSLFQTKEASLIKGHRSRALHNVYSSATCSIKTPSIAQLVEWWTVVGYHSSNP